MMNMGQNNLFFSIQLVYVCFPLPIIGFVKDSRPLHKDDDGSLVI